MCGTGKLGSYLDESTAPSADGWIECGPSTRTGARRGHELPMGQTLNTQRSEREPDTRVWFPCVKRPEQAHPQTRKGFMGAGGWGVTANGDGVAFGVGGTFRN